MIQWTFQPIFDSYAVVLVLVAAMGLALLIRPRFGSLKTHQRWVLLGLRALVVLLVALAMLRPTIIRRSQQPQRATLVILFDKSRSMQLPHASGSQTRWEAQRETLENVAEALAALQDKFDTKIYGYDEELREVAFRNGVIEFPAEPDGSQTDIGTALDQAIRRELGRRLAAVILLGDGAQTAFQPKVDVQQAARMLARLDYPLFTVPFGPASDVVQARDVAVENLPERYTVFVKNELPVKGMVRVRGYVNQELPVELIVQRRGEEPQTEARVEVLARSDGERVPVAIPLVPAEPGEYKLTLRVPEQDGELVVANNQLSAFLTVLEGGLRVAYLYGDLLGEQRLLRRSLDASPDIQLEDLFVDPRNRDRWPVDMSVWWEEGVPDVFLLESVPAAAFRADDLKRLETAVERGAGLMMIGGYYSFGPGGYFGTPLADVLPITMGRFERQEVGLNQPVSRDLHWWGELAMIPARDHPITQLASDQENTALWQSLPPLQGANRIAGVKPRAQVLAETPDNRPLLVAGQYGQGRVLAFAGNSTGRWWQYGRQREHRRFWRQVVLWLARRDDARQNEVWVKLTQRRFNPGANVAFTAGANAATGDVIEDADYEARVIRPDGQTQELSLIREGDHMSGLLEDLRQAGDYLIEVTARNDQQLLGTAKASFQVLDRDVELSNPAADYQLMARLAETTTGGRTIGSEQLPQLLDELLERFKDLHIEVQTKWQLADTALDAWLFLILVTGVLTGEWFLRKKWRLV